MHFIKLTGRILFIALAIIGFVFSGIFIAMQFGWTNVRGTIKERNTSLLREISKNKVSVGDDTQAVTLCKIHTLANYAPDTAQQIQRVYEIKQDNILVSKMIENASLRFKEYDIYSSFKTCENVTIPDRTPINKTAYAWADSAEWGVLESVFARDQEIINKAAHDAGISPRILLGGVIGEQLRFFTSSRESFKSYFEPLKILASLSKFSFGVAGLKPETVARIDQNLKNKESVFYLGPPMENIITYPEGEDEEKVRFERITDTKNTYYSYLYVGLFMRQVTNQWLASGYDISKSPGVLSTLYNLGFNRSVPKANAKPGGAPITVNNTQYSFGDLGEQFYYSGELNQEFPY